MQLLDQQEVITARYASEDADLARISAIRNFVETEEAKLKAHRSKIESDRIKLEAEFETFITLHATKIVSLKKEVADLEACREVVSKPIDEVKKEAALMLADAKRAMRSAEKAQIVADNTVKDNSDRQNDLTEFEKNLENRQVRIAEKEKKNQNEEQNILSERIQLENQKREQEFLIREELEKINKQHLLLKAKESELSVRENLVKEAASNIAKEKTLLTSQQETLKNAFAEAKKKQII